MFFNVRQSWYRSKEIRTDRNALGLMVGVILVDFEPSVGKSKGSEKLSIRCCECSVGGYPCDSVIRSKVTCGIKLMDGSVVKIVLKGNGAARSDDSMSSMAPGYFSG